MRQSAQPVVATTAVDSSQEAVVIDAEGIHAGEPCPQCGGTDTVTFEYREGFTELECPSCGYRSDAAELTALQRYGGSLLEADADTPPLPRKPLEA